MHVALITLRNIPESRKGKPMKMFVFIASKRKQK